MVEGLGDKGFWDVSSLQPLVPSPCSLAQITQADTNFYSYCNSKHFLCLRPDRCDLQGTKALVDAAVKKGAAPGHQ